jgi:hypothetical protein
MEADMTTTPKTDGPHNCIGCTLYEDYDGTMMCINAIHWHGGTPENPPCFEYAPEFLAAIDKRRELADALGEEHLDTMRAMMLAIELAPKELIDEFCDMAREMGLMPEADGYLDDGSPMYRLDDIAERLGVSPAEAEEAMHRMLTEREALGLPNTGVVTDSTLIHRKQ